MTEPVPPQAAVVQKLSFNVTIKQGRNLVAKDKNLFGKKTTSDPYVKVSLKDMEYYGKTKVKNSTLSPIWNEQIEILVDGCSDEKRCKKVIESSIQLTLWDHDLAGADDPMGVVFIPCRDVIMNGKDYASLQWYEIQMGTYDKDYCCKNATGDLEVSVSFRAQRIVDLVPGNVHPILPRYGYSKIFLGLAWDYVNGQAFDIDASCVAVDHSGEINLKESVHFSNLSNSNGSIYHTGDERTGETVGDDEMIHLDLNKIPSNIIALYFVISIITEGKTLDDIQSIRAHIVDKYGNEELCHYTPNRSIGFGGQYNNTSMILARFHREDRKRAGNWISRLVNDTSTGCWLLSPIEEGHASARNFGLLIPHLKSFSRDIIPNIRIDPNERVAIMLKDGIIRVSDFCRYTPTTGAAVTLRESNTTGSSGKLPDWLSFGLAWHVTDGKNIDLDASVICLDTNFSVRDTVWFRQLRSKDGAIIHSGDEKEGDAFGDDETIKFSLNAVDPDVKYLGFVINSFTQQELDDVARASCHLFNTSTKQEIAMYTLANAKTLDKHTALVVACMFRSTKDPGEWYLRIISEPAHGSTVNDNVDDLRNFIQKFPSDDKLAEIVDEENFSFDLSMYCMPAFVPSNEVLSPEEHEKWVAEIDLK